MNRLALALAAALAVSWTAPGRAAGPIPLKVLYAGDPKSERAKDWTSFLEGQFAEVGRASFLTLKDADTRGYDVVILDWSSWIAPRDESEKLMKFAAPALSTAYDRPTILIGGGTLGVGR